ncbi:hypothetical protein AGRA3207_003316 [Actinomadura graeca]|uniref:SGNH hydrolase-type esterase domain-containing protein n=1 Tax=Actinomadura graeca TaxID=2750812 RepID=A0ABX8QU27_9ACTN|nr:hypothetical protein [Actinomadura graeca]QXJ22330.1 hypothetical protein AGRA3207_003316 [Actinomadura graeca]
MGTDLSGARRERWGPGRGRTAMALVVALAAGLVTAVASTAPTTAPALAAAPGKPKAILSLGDSYISGEAGRWAGNANTGASGSAWGTDLAAISCRSGREDSCDHEPKLVYLEDSDVDKGNGCHKSRMAEIKGADIDGVGERDRLNIACSGAVTDNILSTRFKGQIPQIEQLRAAAASHEITTIVLSISGNDLKFSDIIAKCADAYLRGKQLCSVSEAQAFRNRLPEVRGKVVETLREIHKVMQESGQARDSYRLILQSYPAALPASDKYRWRQRGTFLWERYRKGGCPFMNADSEWANKTLIPGIRDMLRDAAFSTNATFLDLTEAFKGHELCTNEADQAGKENNRANPLLGENAEWVRWLPYLKFRTAPWESQGHQQEAIHPNAFGQEALSACLSKTVAGSPQPGQAFTCVGQARAKPSEVRVERVKVHQESWGRDLINKSGRPAVFTYGDQQHAFARDGGCLEHMWWSAGSGLKRDQWGCGIDSDPTAFVIGDQQHVFAKSRRCLEHFWWNAGEDTIHRNRWGCGIDSAPAGFAYGEQQHVFAKNGRCLEHYWWKPGNRSDQIDHNRWGCDFGLTGNPAVFTYQDQQHAFIQNGRCLQHYWWKPDNGTDQIEHNRWRCDVRIDSAPAVFTYRDQQHAFAKNGNCLEHFWWTPTHGTDEIEHNRWGCGIDFVPTAFVQGDQQHAFATNENCLEHFWWTPTHGTDEIEHDRWGCGVEGTPAGFGTGNQQHVFAIGQGRPLQHFWYAGE